MAETISRGGGGGGGPEPPRYSMPMIGEIYKANFPATFDCFSFLLLYVVVYNVARELRLCVMRTIDHIFAFYLHVVGHLTSMHRHMQMTKCGHPHQGWSVIDTIQYCGFFCKLDMHGTYLLAMKPAQTSPI